MMPLSEALIREKSQSDIIYLGGDVDRWVKESGRADNMTLLRLLRLPWCFLSEGDRLTASSGSEMTLQSSLAAPAAELSDDPVKGRSEPRASESERRRIQGCNLSVSASSSPLL